MGKVYRLTTSLNDGDVKRLRVGDVVYFSGELYTMRDMAHMRAIEFFRGKKRPPFDLRGRVVYHCGPIVKGRKVISAGPTTSMRMERMEPELICFSGLKGIVGKGGMGRCTLEALRKFGAVYLEYPGGVGALAARDSKGVKEVYWRDLGDPEAVWVIIVENFGPCFVTMDSHGETLRKLV
ncbi:MAG: FumA C-terminus/TtdB family hydratase beta subunit [Candidatus Methanomethyliaceae archaeon]|nr:FumA C-terminus/TtdB family hydratase beta subunit [Candidatus Methanomethyliaceae archaeon]